MTASLLDTEVIGGIDSHADTLHVAVIDTRGVRLADQEFPTTTLGYVAVLAFLKRHGALVAIGIEGTSSYGAGIARAARTEGIRVLEVNRPDRAERRRVGKSDRIDAYQAADAVLAGRADSTPKDSSIESIRALHNARRSAIKARTATINQIHQQLVVAPDDVRAKYANLSISALLKALATSRPAPTSPAFAVLIALKTLAVRAQFLTTQHTELGEHLDQLVATANPALRAAYGIGVDVAAQLLITAGANPERMRSEAALAALCGVAPVPASSGRTTRHRLSRGGDRAANNALYRIVLVRMSSHAATRAYVTRQRAAGRPTKEIIRMLKRAVVREVYRYLSNAVTVPDISDLRPTRQAKNITVTAAAQHFHVWPSVISNLERGIRRDDELATTYRQWLKAA